MKHTPGPWIAKSQREVWPDSPSAGVVILKERGTVGWKDQRLTSQTHVCYIPDNPRAQFNANAALIAAAPDLLKALEGLSTLIYCAIDRRNLTTEAKKWIKDAEKAIAKARNEK